MKKICILVFVLGILILPIVANAEEKREINVYMFRGEGCIYCENAIEFFKEMDDEYGKYYDLVTYEVWNNDENYFLMEKVGEYFDVEINAVPFIIIGENIHYGFAIDMEEEIKKDILEEYEKDENKRFDIMEKIDIDGLQYIEDENIMAEKSIFEKIFTNIFKIIADVFNIWLG